jgi:hypothetical protein
MLDGCAGVVLAFRGAAGPVPKFLPGDPREGLRDLPAMARWLGGTAVCCPGGLAPGFVRRAVKRVTGTRPKAAAGR